MKNETIIINGASCVTPEAAAAQLGHSLPTLHRRVRAGHLSPIRAHGRTWFALDDIDRLRAPSEGTETGAA